MKPFSIGQIVGIILVASAIIDSYILPKVLLKRLNEKYERALIPEQKAELEKKRKMMMLIIVIAASIPAILGFLFFLGIIPLENN